MAAAYHVVLEVILADTWTGRHVDAAEGSAKAPVYLAQLLAKDEISLRNAAGGASDTPPPIRKRTIAQKLGK